MGLEPTRPCGQPGLNRRRLPISPPGQVVGVTVSCRRVRRLIVLAVLLLAAGCGSSSPSSSDSGAKSPKPASIHRNPKPQVQVPSGAAPAKLVVRDLEKGTGRAAQPGDTLTVDYVGVLFKGGKQFDASFGRAQPFSFVLQANEVIPGWDQGLEGMRVGGRRELIIPAKLGYGAQGSPPAIPPNAALVFVIDLLRVR